MKRYYLETDNESVEHFSVEALDKTISHLPVGEYKLYVVQDKPEPCPCCGMIQEN